MDLHIFPTLNIYIDEQGLTNHYNATPSSILHIYHSPPKPLRVQIQFESTTTMYCTMYSLILLCMDSTDTHPDVQGQLPSIRFNFTNRTVLLHHGSCSWSIRAGWRRSVMFWLNWLELSNFYFKPSLLQSHSPLQPVQNWPAPSLEVSLPTWVPVQYHWTLPFHDSLHSTQYGAPAVWDTEHYIVQYGYGDKGLRLELQESASYSDQHWGPLCLEGHCHTMDFFFSFLFRTIVQSQEKTVHPSRGSQKRSQPPPEKGVKGAGKKGKTDMIYPEESAMIDLIL